MPLLSRLEDKKRKLRFGGGSRQMSLHLNMAGAGAFPGILGEVSTSFIVEL